MKQNKTKYEVNKMIQEKKIYVEKSAYNFPNQYILESVLRRFDKNKYDIKVYEKETRYLLILTPKIEEI